MSDKTIRHDDDPLGYDTRQPFHSVAKAMADDAIEGRNEDAVQSELDGIRKRYGKLPRKTSTTVR